MQDPQDLSARRQQTRQSLLERKGDGTLVQLAKTLDYPPGAIGMLSDVEKERWDHLSNSKHEELRARLGLDFVTFHVLAVPGDADAVVTLRPGSGALSVQAGPKRTRKKYKTVRLPAEWNITPAYARKLIGDHLGVTNIAY